MKNLLAGYERFRAKGWPEQRRLFESLADQGQSPRALVIGCVDSRVDPARIFDTVPGEVLTIRNVANLIPPYAPDGTYHGTSAALEFGIRVLQIPDVVVLGHGQCGGVKSLLQGAPVQGLEFVEPWMSIAESARSRVAGAPSSEERQRRCEHEVVKISLENLKTFPWVADRIDAGTLRLHGAWFDIRFGDLMLLQPDGTFAAEGSAVPSAR
jgi:carbonic anhydrase